MFFWTKHFFSEADPHKQAAQEVLFVCGLSLFPLLVLPLVAHLRNTSDIPSGALLEAISFGQLYLYSFSLLGTLHWLSQKDREDNDRFPPRKYLTVLVWAPAIVGFIVYSADPALNKPLSSTLIWISVFIYLLSVVLYYVLLVFDQLPAPVLQKSIDEESQVLIDNYNNRLED